MNFYCRSLTCPCLSLCPLVCSDYFGSQTTPIYIVVLTLFVISEILFMQCKFTRSLVFLVDCVLDSPFDKQFLEFCAQIFFWNKSIKYFLLFPGATAVLQQSLYTVYFVNKWTVAVLNEYLSSMCWFPIDLSFQSFHIFF